MKQLQRNVHVIEAKDVLKETPFQLYVCSDVHYDSKKCLRERLKKDFCEAKRRGAKIFINGDFFDLMQGRYDPRSGKYDIRPEYKHANYIDCVIDDAAEFLLPFYDDIALISQGNHETNVLKRLETNPIERLVERLNLMAGKKTLFMGGYSGYIRLQFKNSTMRHSKTIKYHHGAGGGARRSKDILRVDVDAGKWPDADIVLKGHTHEKWHYRYQREKITQGGNIVDDEQHHIATGHYKDGSNDGFAGWEVERDFQKKAPGGWFLKFYYVDKTMVTKIEDADGQY